MTINELREKRNQAWNAAKAFVETKRDKDGLLSDEDAATYAQMERRYRTTAPKSSAWRQWLRWKHSFPSLLPHPSPKSP